MALLTLRQQRSRLMPLLPHKLLINGRQVGILQQEHTTINIPAGTFLITIQSMIPLFSASRSIHVDEGLHNTLTITDRERWWDILFTIDLILWVAELFFTLPAPWDLIYDIFTNGYFAIWIIYEWIIRKRYFRLQFYQTPHPQP